MDPHPESDASLPHALPFLGVGAAGRLVGRLGLVGLARGKYIAWVFGAGPQTDAYMAAFRLPDLMNNFLVGGAVSITFITILNRYRERGEEDEGERVLVHRPQPDGLVLTAASIILMFLRRSVRALDQSRFSRGAGGCCART